MINKYQGWPGTIITGAGATDTLGEEVKALGGKKVILFSGPHISKTPMVQGPIEKMRSEGLEVLLFNEIGANPTEEMVVAGAEAMKEFKPDVIIAIGGGSPIDCAKAANVLYTHGGQVEDYNVNTGGVERIRPILLPFIAVPTTAGSGSEVTNVGVITSTKRHVKYGVLSPFLVPTISVLDPRLCTGLSPYVTASTGIDAMTHCIESYVSFVSFCIADAEALQGIRMIKDYLPIAYKDGENVEAREKMLQASMMAGASFNVNNLGLCHQMAHQLSSYFGVPHGVANALLLPEVMRFNLPAAVERYRDIAEALGCDISGLTAQEAAEKGIEKVEAMCREMNIPKYLEDVGVDKAQVPAMATTALQDGVGATNPRPTTVEECEQVYYKCFRD